MAEEMTVKEIDEVVVRFSGDSGDGMQLAGNMFSNISATEFVPRKDHLQACPDSRYISVRERFILRAINVMYLLQ